MGQHPSRRRIRAPMCEIFRAVLVMHYRLRLRDVDVVDQPVFSAISTAASWHCTAVCSLLNMLALAAYAL